MKKWCTIFALLPIMPLRCISHEELRKLSTSKTSKNIIDVIQDKNTTEDDLQKIAKMTFNTIQGMRGASAMHILATNNDYVPIVRLYNVNKEFYKKDINARDAQEKTPLHYAAQYNADKVIKALFTDPNVDIFAKNSTGMTAVHYAARENATQALAELLRGRTGPMYNANKTLYLHAGIFPSIYMADDNERTPLHYAAIKKNKEAALMLYNESGVNLPAYVLQKDVDRKTALDYWPDLINFTDNNGNTPLHYALYELLAAKSDKEKSEARNLVVDLIDKKADRSIKNNKHETSAQLLKMYGKVRSMPIELDLKNLARALKAL